jgi:hypothetical protein
MRLVARGSVRGVPGSRPLPSMIQVATSMIVSATASLRSPRVSVVAWVFAPSDVTSRVSTSNTEPIIFSHFVLQLRSQEERSPHDFYSCQNFIIKLRHYLSNGNTISRGVHKNKCHQR